MQVPHDRQAYEGASLARRPRCTALRGLAFRRQRRRQFGDAAFGAAASFGGAIFTSNAWFGEATFSADADALHFERARILSPALRMRGQRDGCSLTPTAGIHGGPRYLSCG
jgi:hypothetical protein